VWPASAVYVSFRRVTRTVLLLCAGGIRHAQLRLVYSNSPTLVRALPSHSVALRASHPRRRQLRTARHARAAEADREVRGREGAVGDGGVDEGAELRPQHVARLHPHDLQTRAVLPLSSPVVHRNSLYKPVRHGSTTLVLTWVKKTTLRSSTGSHLAIGKRVIFLRAPIFFICRIPSKEWSAGEVTFSVATVGPEDRGGGAAPGEAAGRAVQAGLHLGLYPTVTSQCGSNQFVPGFLSYSVAFFQRENRICPDLHRGLDDGEAEAEAPAVGRGLRVLHLHARRNVTLGWRRPSRQRPPTL
jgi:hypothetical protein